MNNDRRLYNLKIFVLDHQGLSTIVSVIIKWGQGKVFSKSLCFSKFSSEMVRRVSNATNKGIGIVIPNINTRILPHL